VKAAAAESIERLSAAQQRLVERHLHLADQIARWFGRTTPPHVRAEVASIARHGLVLAAAAFHPDCGHSFGRFARGRIRGLVSHELRRRSVAANDVLLDAPGPDGERAELGDAYADGMLACVTGDGSRRASLGPRGRARRAARRGVRVRRAGAGARRARAARARALAAALRGEARVARDRRAARCLGVDRAARARGLFGSAAQAAAGAEGRECSVTAGRSTMDFAGAWL